MKKIHFLLAVFCILLLYIQRGFCNHRSISAISGQECSLRWEGVCSKTGGALHSGESKNAQASGCDRHCNERHLCQLWPGMLRDCELWWSWLRCSIANMCTHYVLSRTPFSRLFRHCDGWPRSSFLAFFCHTAIVYIYIYIYTLEQYSDLNLVISLLMFWYTELSFTP